MLSHNCFRLSVVLALVFAVQGEGLAKTMYVASTGDDTTGESWATALRSLQDAIYAAEEGDTLWVEKAGIGWITIVKRLYLYGGFNGTETELAQRKLGASNRGTVLSGAPGVQIEAETRMDGFDIRDGYNYGYTGGLVIHASTTLSNCQVVKNRGYWHSGGIDAGPSLTLINCLVSKNKVLLDDRFTDAASTAILYYGLEPLRIINCTIADNETDPCCRTSIPMIYVRGSGGIDIKNSIILGNIELDRRDHPTLTASYSDLWGDWPGEGNINVDPLFKDNGYRLGIGSPCIDAGTVTGLVSDLNGDPRPIDIPGMGHEGGNAYDMGAYEFQEIDLLTPTPTKTRTFTKTPTNTLTPTITPTPTETGTPTPTETPVVPPTPDPRADINQDGKVDSKDLLILWGDWGHVMGQ